LNADEGGSNSEGGAINDRFALDELWSVFNGSEPFVFISGREDGNCLELPPAN